MSEEARYYPGWICNPCGQKHGSKAAGMAATWHEGQCGWCGTIKTPVTEPRDFGNPPAPTLIPLTKHFTDHLSAIIKPQLEELDTVWAEHGPAAEAALAATGATIDTIGGNCPVQAEGTVDGKEFYFRARGAGWQFHVADTKDQIFDDALMTIYADYGEWPDAGWMPQHEAYGFIIGGIEAFRSIYGEPA